VLRDPEAPDFTTCSAVCYQVRNRCFLAIEVEKLARPTLTKGILFMNVTALFSGVFIFTKSLGDIKLRAYPCTARHFLRDGARRALARMPNRNFAVVSLGLSSVFLLTLVGCATAPQLATPEQLFAPEPRADTDGRYLNPYTRDGVVADWVDKAVNAQMGAAVGSSVGAYAGQAMVEQIPVLGGWLGGRVGERAGREIAIRSSGGWEYIRATSDSSFDNVNDYAVYLYVSHSTHPHYDNVLSMIKSIYPELGDNYYRAIANASRGL